MLIEVVLNAPDAHLCGAFEAGGSPALGRDAGDFLGRPTGVLLTDACETALNNADLLIDFTRPAATLVHLDECVRRGIGMVIGTTGFEAHERARITAAAQQIPIVFAPNMSVGVNATLKLLELAATISRPITTSRWSKRTTATKSMHPRAPHWPWAKRSLAPSDNSYRMSPCLPAKG